jgi:hypothetical protein
MKVSASPFEAPIGTSRSGEKQAKHILRGEERDASLYLVRSTSSSNSVRADLESATKEALKELVEKLKSEQDDESSGERHTDGGTKRAVAEKKNSSQPKETSSIVAEILISDVFASGANSRLGSGSAFAAVSKLQRTFERVRQQRGREVYRQAARERALLEIESQLSRAGAEYGDPLELISNPTHPFPALCTTDPN